MDLAYNIGVATFVVEVDITAPAAVTIDTVDPFNPRRPAVVLEWIAPGDDGTEGGPAAFYYIRYSKAPITSANFAQACELTPLAETAAIPAPAAPGLQQSFEITGPDSRSPGDPCRFIVGTQPSDTLYFAVRAFDDVGNPSLLTTENVKSTNGLRFRFSQMNKGSFVGVSLESSPIIGGDIDGDGRDDLLIGAFSHDGFCLIRGRENPGASIDLSQDTMTQCLFDTWDSNAGLQLASAGDVNGDGLDDVLSVSFRDEDDTERTRIRIYLGQASGTLNTEPDISVIHGTTAFSLGKVIVASGGNINGDMNEDTPVDDVVIGLPESNLVYVIPGSIQWGTVPLEIDLANPADQITHSVLTLSLADDTVVTNFGMAVGGIGNVLPDGLAGDPQYDELMVSQKDGPPAAFIIPGRAWTGALDITISTTLDGSGGEDTVAVCLIPEPAEVDSDSFCSQISPAGDLDGDGLPEVGCTHITPSFYGRRALYLFSGDAIEASRGTTLQIGAVQDNGNTWIGDDGTVITGSYWNLGFPGNLDDSAVEPNASGDMIYGYYNGYVSFGSVFVRLNGGATWPTGTFAELDLEITDPFNPGNANFGGYYLAPLGDFTGDGLPDLVIGTVGSGYLVLIY